MHVYTHKTSVPALPKIQHARNSAVAGFIMNATALLQALQTQRALESLP
jgi:hypothetical protein